MRTSSLTNLHRVILCAAFSIFGFLSAASVRAADIYAEAVAHSGRSADDVKRDALDHPADMLRLAGIKPGMQVADVLAGDGYYSELLSYIVGPKGHVQLLNNAGFDKFSNNAWQQRIADHHLANVEHRTVDMANLGLADASLDAVLLIKVYHDMYWVDESFGWPKIDVGGVLDQLAKALKPGGVLLLVDHSAKPGTGSADAGRLHRIDEVYARKDFEAHGFKFVKSSDLLRKPEDKRDLISYKGPALGKTDRFVYLFRKPAK
jgi:predicted methyltransferase